MYVKMSSATLKTYDWIFVLHFKASSPSGLLGYHNFQHGVNQLSEMSLAILKLLNDNHTMFLKFLLFNLSFVDIPGASTLKI